MQYLRRRLCRLPLSEAAYATRAFRGAQRLSGFFFKQTHNVCTLCLATISPGREAVTVAKTAVGAFSCSDHREDSMKYLFLTVTAVMGILGMALDSLAYSGNDFLQEMDEPGLCALTFDDGPSRFTEKLLDMMAAEQVQATFFVLGSNAVRMPHIIHRQLAEGHEVASHSWSHPNLNRISTAKIRNELLMTSAALQRFGVTPKFFRPPYGNFTPYVVTLARELGMEIAIWSHDSRDWKRLPQSYAALLPCQAAEHRHGVFLFHDIHERTVNDFPRIVRELRASGCRRFVTLSEYVTHLLPPGEKLLQRPPFFASHRRTWCHAAHRIFDPGQRVEGMTPAKRPQQALVAAESDEAPRSAHN